MPGDPEYYRTAIERARPAQPVFGPFHNAPMPCGWWKHKPREPRTQINNTVPALQIQATGDTRTTYRQGLGMHKALRGSKLGDHPGADPRSCSWTTPTPAPMKQSTTTCSTAPIPQPTPHASATEEGPVPTHAILLATPPLTS